MFITAAKVLKNDSFSTLQVCAITCSISAHAQTLNEYPDAENTFEYKNYQQISKRSKYHCSPKNNPAYAVGKHQGECFQTKACHLAQIYE